MDRRALHKQFLQQFPIEHLGNMTLEEYTNLNREDSFCYWLEVKTQELGSIWGGSSYKFGIYRYEKRPDNPTVVVSDDEYAWYKKYNASNKEEAFKVVLNSIIGIAESAQKGDFQAIEEDSTFGNVVKWKIAFLYANEMLLPIYKRDMLEKIASEYGFPNPSKAKNYELQHFLIKQKGDKDLYDFYDELLSIMDKEQKNKRVWLCAPGEGACMWKECQRDQTIRLGWNPIGDISKFSNREELTKALQIAYKKEDSFRNDSLALWQFVHEVQQGDIVYAKKGLNKIIGRGIVESDYYYDDSLSTYRHIRKVKWTHIGDWEYSFHNLPLKTLTDISKYPEFTRRLNEMIVEGKVEETKSNFYNDKYKAYINLLLNNHNLILNGAPGTGKTYLAKQVAAQIIYEGNVPERFEEDTKFIEQCGFVQFHPSYDYTDFVEGLRPTHPNKDGNIGFERKDGIFKAFCKRVLIPKPTFPSAEEMLRLFKEGLRRNNGITLKSFRSETEIRVIVNEKENIAVQIASNWSCTDEHMLKYLRKGECHENDTYTKTIGDYILENYMPERISAKMNHRLLPNIFIIDEINRGEISKIFGELFFSVDPGYRGVKGKVQTQYQNLITEDDPFKDGFYIPENVYIIGTMNDIDRSVECMDFAMRRRFTFKEITAEESARNMELGTDATERMMSLNNAISEIDGFNSSFHIGAAYFKGVDDFDALWELKLAGLLKEYLRGMPDAEDSLEALKKAYYLSNE